MLVVVTNKAGRNNVFDAFNYQKEAKAWARKHCVGCSWRIATQTK